MTITPIGLSAGKLKEGVVGVSAGGTGQSSALDVDTNVGGMIYASTTSAMACTDVDDLCFDYTNKRLGIGTSAPGYPLHIKSSISSTLLIEQTNNSTNIFNLSLYNSGTSGDAGIIAFVGKDSANNINVYGYIKNSIISNTDGSESGSFLFYTQNAGTRAERFRISYDGKLKSSALYNSTGSGGRTVYCDSNGNLYCA